MTKKLPTQIRKQVEAAEALLAASNAPAAQPEPTPATTEPVEAAAPAPAAEPAPVEPSPAPQPAAPKDDEATWERRYRTLQGMHNQNIADLKRRLGDMESANNTLKSQLKALQSAPAPAPATNHNDAETFGQDMLDMVERVADARYGRTLSTLVERIEQLQEQLQGTRQAVVQTTEEVFYAKLKEQVPDYVEINADQAFLDWLGDVDPVYGVPRQNGLDAACQALDATRAANVFKAFKELTARAQAPARRSARPPLESQIAPSTAGGAAAPRENTPQVITVAQVEKFYADVRRGAYRGREAEQNALEQAINTALAQGRVVDRTPHHAIA